MATLSYELGKPKQDGTRRVSIILSHKGNRKRIPTLLVVESKDISRNGNITSKKVLKIINDKLSIYNDRLYDFEMKSQNTNATIDLIYDSIKRDTANIDFFKYAESWLQHTTLKGKRNYISMLNSLHRYVQSDSLPFASINYSFLEGFKRFLDKYPRARNLYLVEMKHIFNEAVKENNTENNQVISSSAFEYLKIPKYTANTNDRVITEENLIKIFNFSGTRRIGMARDCYILSFCLIGMNSVDLYNCTDLHDGVLQYNRTKTKDRRKDHAYIEIDVPDFVKPLFSKYKGKDRVFNFYTKYTTAANFNKHLNKGLTIIANRLGIPKFDFYSARHTWASIARNKLGIDKYTIHEALNHTSELGVTDIYIQRDYSNINKANKKVIEYIMSLIDK